jgi:hypothetical protein
VGGKLHITYRPRADTTPEGELSALASVYAYLLKDRRSKKANKAASEPVGRDGTRINGDSANVILPE